MDFEVDCTYFNFNFDSTIFKNCKIVLVLEIDGSLIAFRSLVCWIGSSLIRDQWLSTLGCQAPIEKPVCMDMSGWKTSWTKAGRKERCKKVTSGSKWRKKTWRKVQGFREPSPFIRSEIFKKSVRQVQHPTVPPIDKGSKNLLRPDKVSQQWFISFPDQLDRCRQRRRRHKKDVEGFSSGLGSTSSRCARRRRSTAARIIRPAAASSLTRPHPWPPLGKLHPFVA